MLAMQELCGVVGQRSENKSGLSADVAAMLDHMMRDQAYAIASSSYSACSIGALAYKGAPLLAEHGDITIAVAGDVYETGDATTVANQLVKRYADVGVTALQQLNGLHAIALWDDHSGQLHLVTDRCGFRKLYFAEAADKLYFGTRYTAVASSMAPALQLDPAAVYEFCRFGYFLGDKTFLQGVQPLPPGTLLSWSAGKTTCTPYWDYEFNSDPDASSELAETVQRAVSRQAGGYHCLQMTGGLDSRVIGGFLRKTHPEARAYATTMGSAGSIELIYAKKLAGDLNVPHRPTYLDTNTYDAVADDALWRNEGTLLNHTGWRLAADSWVKSEGFDCISNGFFANALRSGGLLYTTDDSLSDDALIPIILEMVRDMSNEADLNRLFRKPYANDLRGDGESHIRSLLKTCPTDRAPQKLDYVDYHTRQRNYLGMNLVYARQHGRTFAPLTDNAVVDLGLRMDSNARMRSRAYEQMILDHLPDACRAPYTRTQLPLRASRAELLARKAYGRLYYKILPGLTGGRIGRKNQMAYVPYKASISGGSRRVFEENMPYLEAFAEFIDIDFAHKMMSDYTEDRRPGYGPAYSLNTLCLWQKHFGS